MCPSACAIFFQARRDSCSSPKFDKGSAFTTGIFSPTTFSVTPHPVTGYHGYNTRTQFGDFDLTILPKNERVRFIVGYSPERYSGPFFSTYHIGGNEFQLFSHARTRANDFRVGADGKVGPIDWTFLQGFRRFRDDSFVDSAVFINANPAAARFTSFNRNEPTRGSINFTRASIHTLVAKKLDITGSIIHSRATSNSDRWKWSKISSA